MSSLSTARNNRLRDALAVFVASALLAAPLGVALSVSYRLLFVFEAWAVGSPYSPEHLEFSQPARVLAAIGWAYVICAVPVIVSSAALAWRTWVRGGFGYIYAAATASTTMALYMAGAAYVFHRELVSVVTYTTAIDGVLYASIVSVIGTAMLRWAGVVKPPAPSGLS